MVESDRVFVATSLGLFFCLLAAFFGNAIYWGPPVGDLVRVGFWPDRDYRPLQDDITIERRYSGVHGVLEPDIFVLGDSFSERNLWQSRLTDVTGLSTLTYSYGHDDTLPYCIDEWVERMASRLRNKQVIIEVIERHFMWRFAPPPNACNQAVSSEPLEISPGIVARPKDALTWDGLRSSLDIRYQYEVLRNVWNLRKGPETRVSFDVVNAPLSRPDLFSNRASDRLLFLKGELAKSSWTEAQFESAMERLRRFKDELATNGNCLLIVTVPDKSTTYQGYMSDPLRERSRDAIARHLERAGIDSLDLRTSLRAAVERTRDLYLPDDTHLSLAGYRILGEAVSQSSCSRRLE